MVRAEGCRVRPKREERTRTRKRVEKEGLDFLIRCSQENRIGEKTFGVAKEDRSGLLGWDTCIVREKDHTHLFQLLEIILFTPYKLIILERPKE